ncbi:MAG TPA: AraC family transcriptional regulator [Firmicutes bacterium]|nr:AraC family transcriptional regulator [Bacillota bacterium]
MDDQWWPKRIQAGEVIYPPGGTYGPRLQRDYEIVMLHSGSLTLYVDDHVLQIDAGTAFLVTPGHMEFYQFAKDSCTHHSFICINNPVLPESWYKYTWHPPQIIPLSPRMRSLAQEAIYWIRHKQAENLLVAIGYHSLWLFYQEMRLLTEIPSAKNEIIYFALKYIYANYDKDICLSDVCRHVAVSAEHLCRIFKAQYKTSPIAFLWQYRTKRALELLASTGLSISDIAVRCGFKTPFHLYHRVKSLTGLSPTQYRKQSWNGQI